MACLTPMIPPSLSAVRIEPAGVEHLEAIAALARIVWRARYPGIIALEQIEYMLARMYDVRVMEEECGCGVTYDRLLVGDTLYGFASYGPIAEPGALKLHKLYVHPEVQRLKLGSALLRHVEASARGHGYATLVLAVNRKNEIGRAHV